MYHDSFNIMNRYIVKNRFMNHFRSHESILFQQNLSTKSQNESIHGSWESESTQHYSDVQMSQRGWVNTAFCLQIAARASFTQPFRDYVSSVYAATTWGELPLKVLSQNAFSDTRIMVYKGQAIRDDIKILRYQMGHLISLFWDEWDSNRRSVMIRKHRFK